MGQPAETKHLVVSNDEAIISPPWSIHSGCGHHNYGFIWGMAGENFIYTDMDPVNINDLKIGRPLRLRQLARNLYGEELKREL